MLNPDKITSALVTPAPAPNLPNACGMSHWRTVCTVYTETGETYLVTGYDWRNPYLSRCSASVRVSIKSIYETFERDDPAIIDLKRQNEPHCHYTGAA